MTNQCYFCSYVNEDKHTLLKHMLKCPSSPSVEMSQNMVQPTNTIVGGRISYSSRRPTLEDYDKRES